ncbi:MAG: long-chain fatty acid transport protein [Alphaproteobacteria bacterium]|jgi:long-chain fatty acid transport protein
MGGLGAAMGAPVEAQASGMALREFGANGLGTAYAGATAAADDVTFMAFNPAGITRQRGENLSANMTLILPKAEFSLQSSTTQAGGTIGGGNGGSNIGKEVYVPAFFYSREITPDLFAGISLTVPFGLATNYETDWAGRYHALETDIKVYNLNPVAAYRVNPQLSVAAGVQLVYARGVLSNAVDFGTIAAGFGGIATQEDGIATSEGDDVALGYNFGILYQIRPNTRIGAAYRSKLHTGLKGGAEFNNSPRGALVAGVTGQFVRSEVESEVNFPETASFGIHHQVNPRFAIMAEAAWTAWSRIEEFRIDFANAAQSDSVIASNWDDTWFVAIGATYQVNDKWNLRGGLAYDQSPVPAETRTPRVPDEDRTWFSIGARYAISSSSFVDIGYTHLFFDKATTQLSTAADTNNQFRGNLSGSFDTSVDVLSAQVRVNF